MGKEKVGGGTGSAAPSDCSSFLSAVIRRKSRSTRNDFISFTCWFGLLLFCRKFRGADHLLVWFAVVVSQVSRR